ncbi:MAG: glycosyltransferase [Bacteroidetes bacterium]|nr:glycosyltransferase [Bacteroidota bacterium]
MKIFMLLSRVPFPTEKGDKLRAFHHLVNLSARHDIHLCALNDVALHPEAIHTLDKYCKSVHIIRLDRFTIGWNVIKALFSGKPLQVGYFYSCSAKRKIRQLIEKIHPDRIFCQLIRTAEYVKPFNIPKTLDYQDVFSKGVERRMATSPWIYKPFFRLEYKRLLKYEGEIFNFFDQKVIISYPDRDLIPHPDRENIFVIPNGVDFNYFRPVDQPATYDLVFTGNMGYPPNINSACYLVQEILPIILKKRPETRVLIAGANPHPMVKKLAGPQVTVTGWVKDIRTCYAAARIFIAPMQIGTGLQNKLLEAMAMKLPCVTSTLANQALGAAHGKEIMVCSTPATYAATVIELLENQDNAKQLAQRGHEFVTLRYSWETETTKLGNIICHGLPE